MLPLLAPNRDRMAPEMTEITIEILRKTVEELTGRVDDENRRAVLMVIESYTKRITRLKQRVGGIRPPGIGAAADRGAALGEGLSQGVCSPN